LISLYLRPDKTQVVKGQLKKDKTLFITAATEIQSYWAALTEQTNNYRKQTDEFYDEESLLMEDEEENLALSDLFYEIKSVVSTTYEEFHIILPDSLFCMINCAEFLTEEEFMHSVRAKTNKADEDVYYSFPLLTAPGGQPRKTFFAIERKFVNRLIAAAKEENITVSSIEPASMAFIRSCASWQEEHFLLEIFEDQATMVSYSPIGGIFSMNVPSLTAKQLNLDVEAANREIQSMFAIHDYTAEKIFSSMNVNVPFVILTEDKKILEIHSLKERSVQANIFPSFVNADIDSKDHQEWMVPIGAFLQNYEIEDELYATLPPFLQISSANVLPQNIQMGAKFQQWKKLAKKYSKLAIAFLSVLTVLDIAGILYFSSVTISPKLQADYDAAQKDIKDIDAEIKTLAAAKKEHEYPIEAFTQIVKDKPNNCGFSSIMIGSSGQGKSADEKWIRLNAVSSDPLIFQDYVAALSNDDIFAGVGITKMNTEASSGFKTAEISIGKGKVQ